jgi:hypothetical protein
MDPYLEAPDIWPGVHIFLMTAFVEQLSPLLEPNYYADMDSRIVVDRIWDNPPEMNARADVAIVRPEGGTSTVVLSPPVYQAPLELTIPVAEPIRLVTLYIRKHPTDEVVTVVELLSPTNKRPGDHRREYLGKRMDYLESRVHLVEIDLLRRWPRMPLEGTLPSCDYLAVVSNSYKRPACDVWPISLRQPLPILPIPLLRPDPTVPLDLNLALHTIYQRGRYHSRIDYDRPPEPPLAKEEAEWAAALLEK